MHCWDENCIEVLSLTSRWIFRTQVLWNYSFHSQHIFSALAHHENTKIPSNHVTFSSKAWTNFQNSTTVKGSICIEIQKGENSKVYAAKFRSQWNFLFFFWTHAFLHGKRIKVFTYRTFWQLFLVRCFEVSDDFFLILFGFVISRTQRTFGPAQRSKSLQTNDLLSLDYLPTFKYCFNHGFNVLGSSLNQQFFMFLFLENLFVGFICSRHVEIVYLVPRLLFPVLIVTF